MFYVFPFNTLCGGYKIRCDCDLTAVRLLFYNTVGLYGLIPITDEHVGVPVKLRSLRTPVYLSASEVMIHEAALYQVYVPLTLLHTLQ